MCLHRPPPRYRLGTPSYTSTTISRRLCSEFTGPGLVRCPPTRTLLSDFPMLLCATQSMVQCHLQARSAYQGAPCVTLGRFGYAVIQRRTRLENVRTHTRVFHHHLLGLELSPRRARRGFFTRLVPAIAYTRAQIHGEDSAPSVRARAWYDACPRSPCAQHSRAYCTSSSLGADLGQDVPAEVASLALSSLSPRHPLTHEHDYIAKTARRVSGLGRRASRLGGSDTPSSSERCIAKDPA
ncbi:hypothetical protein C2E23DRAFT_602317 [Lenzites betulinus]|nr:hypothetical protein C2E23DRAFT_602317 [Lenzites betulinus]